MQAGGNDADRVARKPRLEVEESLRRCADLKIDPHSTAPYIGDLAQGERLRVAAAAVIDEVCLLMEGIKTAVVLTDEKPQVIDVRTDDADLSAWFASNGGLIGSDWSEEAMGTTAIGLAIKHRKPMSVAGDEHYVANLKDCTAAAAPIFDPFTAELIGGLVMSARLEAASPHMLPAVAQAARAIEQRLYEGASFAEHALLARFDATCDAAPDDAVLVCNERLVLGNADGTALLRGVERHTLWEQARDAVAGVAGTTSENLLTLRDGRSIPATFEKADPRSVRAGVLVHVAADAFVAPDVLVGNAPDGHLEQQIAAFASSTSGLLVLGEAGVGKLTAAEEVHRRSGRSRLAIIDVATDAVNGGPDMLRDLAAAASHPDSTLIVRHLECVSQRALTTIRSLVSHRREGAQVIATLRESALPADHAELRDLFADQLPVPPLHQRAHELPQIVSALMRRHGATGQMQPAALQALARHEWPGNVRDLEAVVAAVVASRRTCDIALRDLPPQLAAQGGPRRLTRMEHLERSAIQEALWEVQGNRTKAAEILQIGRATLYRKIKSYGLDAEVPAAA